VVLTEFQVFPVCLVKMADLALKETWVHKVMVDLKVIKE
jgi:hypothetical protein